MPSKSISTRVRPVCRDRRRRRLLKPSKMKRPRASTTSKETMEISVRTDRTETVTDHGKIMEVRANRSAKKGSIAEFL